MVGNPAAERRADSGGDEQAHAEDRLHHAELGFREDFHESGLRSGNKRRASRLPGRCATGYQLAQTPWEKPHSQRRQNKQQDRAAEIDFAAKLRPDSQAVIGRTITFERM